MIVTAIISLLLFLQDVPDVPIWPVVSDTAPWLGDVSQPLKPVEHPVLDSSKWPLPPDLIHVNHNGCNLVGHRSEPPIYVSIDAKTGIKEEIQIWFVIPFSEYEPLPDKTQREKWVSDKDIFRADGTSTFIPREATDVCSAWMRFANTAVVKEHHSQAR